MKGIVDMATADEEREIWRIGDVSCVLIACCAGAELQVRGTGGILLRELYPTKSDLYERANLLKSEYARSVSP